MKNPLPLTLLAGCLSAFGQDVATYSGPVVIERGPHHRVWECYTSITNAYQENLIVTNHYTELQTGISYWNNNRWEDSNEVVESYEKGAVARHGLHQVIFSPQFNVPGVIDLLTSDGQRVRGTPVGLAYHDDATGQSVLIATLKDSLGELLPPNQVIYSDCFSNVTADVRFTYTRAGLEQDVILRENPPSPQEYGFDPATTRLEVWTEFQGTSAPQISSRIAWQTPLTPSGSKMAEPDTIDDTLQFGAMMTGPGKAFALDSDKMDGTELIPVVKRWQKVQGNTYLIESVWFNSVQASLQALPSAAPQGASLRRQPADHLDLPSTNPQLAQLAPMPIARLEVQQAYRSAVSKKSQKDSGKVAFNSKSERSPGFVLDYTLLNSSNNFTFRGDMTYYLTNTVVLSGTTTIEGGTVVKYSTNASASINISGAISCLASAYRPAVFTAIDDDSVGEIISGLSTGVPTTGGYGGNMIYLNFGTDLRYLRFCFARQALYFYNYSGITLTHAQFVKCQKAIYGDFATYALRNVLFQQNVNPLYGTTYTATGENLTFSECGQMAAELYAGTSKLTLANSLMVQITNASSVSLTTSYCQTATSTLGNFQTTGAGNLYLANNAWRGVGTTGITPSLLADLTNKTTYPPVILTNAFTTNTVLAPIVPRNTGSPDLGYHYDPIDYAFSGNVLNSATLMLTNGVAVGVFGSTGIELQTGAKLYSVGTPMNLNRFVRYQAVQEQPIQWGGSNATVSLMNVAATYDGLPSLNFRFTDFSLLAASVYKRYVVNVNTYSMVANMSFTDCQIRGGYLYFLPYYADSRTMTLAATNNLVERSAWSMTQGYSGSTAPFAVLFYNNLFRLSTITLVDSINTAAWAIYDNLFDQTTLTSSGTPNNGYNGYYSTTALPGGIGNVSPPFPLYQNTSLDRPYYLTNGSPLMNVGSRLATLAGLFHYTVQTNQVKETNSTVDIGMHYVAMSNGVPVDTDSDGLPDYFEDRNGNGVTDSGETSMNNPDTDGDGRNDGQEVAEGTDPLDGSSTRPVRLTYFKFNGGTFNGELGEAPLASTGAILTNSFDGSGMQLNTGSGNILKYREVEANGKVNIVCSNFSIRFMYKPNWSSTNYVPGAGLPYGTGPGQDVRLWEFGDPDLTSGGMALTIDSTGTILTFKTRDNAGNIATASGTTTLISNTWFQIELVACKTSWYSNASIYIFNYNTMIASNENVPVLPLPPASTRSGGFCIGCSATAGSTKQAKGEFDEFEIFNYNLGATGAYLTTYTPISAKASTNPNKIELSMRFSPNTQYEIKRRPEAGVWSTLATGITNWSYVDTSSLIVGQKYDYGLFLSGGSTPLNTITCGINITNTDYRGKVILLVATNVTNSIRGSLDQFKQDLIGDGWNVIRHDVQTNNDSNWAANINNIVANRNLLISDYNADPNNTKAVIIIGHVSIPYSGITEVDGHNTNTIRPDHRGAWAADSYYGDVDGVWHDSSINHINIDSPQTTNIPGDGKYDDDYIPTNTLGVSKIEMAVGRIDFANLPAFAPKSESDLLNQYFTKNHRYRMGKLSFENRAISVSFFGPSQEDDNQTVYKNANQNASALFGFDSGKIISGHLFKEKTGCLWGFNGGFGQPAAVDGVWPWLTHYTTNLANPLTNEPPIGFFMLKGSYFGDLAYWTNDNIFRAVLGTPNYGLAAVWFRFNPWYVETMAVGETLADAYVRSVNTNNINSNYVTRQMIVIGDPTLKLNVVSPPSNLTAINYTNTVVLGWNSAYDPTVQYFIYRASNTNSAFTNRISAGPVNGCVFTDTNPNVAEKYYQIRALKIINTGCGSYTNVSQGLIVNY